MADYRAERVRAVPGASEFPPQHDLPQRRGYNAYAAAAAGRAAAPHAIRDVASVLGLPADSLNPTLLAALTPLLDEMDALRWQAGQESRRRALLEQAADRHWLLPCYNRRAFLRELDALLAGGAAEGYLALIHVGGLEELRLDHGLAAADDALRHVGATILGNLRVSDMVGGLGGGDFAAVMLGRQADPTAKPREIARRINDPPLVWEGQPVVLPVAVGVAPLAPGLAAGQVLGEADRVLRRPG